jgi:hypothetical protein
MNAFHHESSVPKSVLSHRDYCLLKFSGNFIASLTIGLVTRGAHYVNATA